MLNRLVITLVLASAVVSAQPAPSRSLDGLRHDIDAILGDPALQHGFWGVLIKPLDRDETWYELNANKLMMPASTLKVVTLAAAADVLGWDFRYETSVFAVGTVNAGVLHGDLVVVGSGDPSLDDWDGAATRLFADWAARLRAAGISAIDGRIVGDDNAFEDERLGLGWAWDDLPTGFAAGVGALQFNEGSVQVRLAPGDAVGDKAVATLTPATGGLVLDNFIVTAPADSVGHVERRRLPGSSRLELRGTLPLRGFPFSQTASVDNPTLYFVRALRESLLADGIAVTGAAVDIDDLMSPPSHAGLTPLIVYASAPLSELATTMMKLSQNQYAEALLKTIGMGTAAGGRMAVQQTLQQWNIDPAGLLQADGSGLSRYNYITPGTMTAVLAHIAHDARLGAPYEATLPVAGRDGTLEFRMRRTTAAGKAQVKTGSMTGVRAVAGYVRTADGEMTAVTVFANDFDSSSDTVITTAIDDVLARLAAYRSQ